MTKRNSTKRALLNSAAALLLCFVSLLGSTFAWFTDSASSAYNTIQSGNLDIKVSYMPIGGDPEKDWIEVTENTKLFNDQALYEPGYTEAFWMKVENTGTLALKYDLRFTIHEEIFGTNVEGEEFALSEALDLKVSQAMTIEELVFGDYRALESINSLVFETYKSLNEATGDYLGIFGPLKGVDDTAETLRNEAYHLVVLQMPITVGNEANHNGENIPSIKLGVNVVATQFAYEKDTFDEQYDKDAVFLQNSASNKKVENSTES